MSIYTLIYLYFFGVMINMINFMDIIKNNPIAQLKIQLLNDKGKFYYGIIDVPRNRVIFHTNEEIIKYIPYLDYACYLGF